MSLALKLARLCLDCDHLAERAVCPRCGSRAMFPVARWLRPLGGPDAGTAAPEARRGAPRPSEARVLIVVPRDNRRLHTLLRRCLRPGAPVSVVYERRVRERRRTRGSPPVERRRRDRRQRGPAAWLYEIPSARPSPVAAVLVAAARRSPGVERAPAGVTPR